MNYDDMNNLRCGNPDMSSSSGQEENQSLRCQGNSTGDYSEKMLSWSGKSLLSGGQQAHEAVRDRWGPGGCPGPMGPRG